MIMTMILRAPSSSPQACGLVTRNRPRRVVPSSDDDEDDVREDTAPTLADEDDDVPMEALGEGSAALLEDVTAHESGGTTPSSSSPFSRLGMQESILYCSERSLRLGVVHDSDYRDLWEQCLKAFVATRHSIADYPRAINFVRAVIDDLCPSMPKDADISEEPGVEKAAASFEYVCLWELKIFQRHLFDYLRLPAASQRSAAACLDAPEQLLILSLQDPSLADGAESIERVGTVPCVGISDCGRIKLLAHTVRKLIEFRQRVETLKRQWQDRPQPSSSTEGGGSAAALTSCSSSPFLRLALQDDVLFLAERLLRRGADDFTFRGHWDGCFEAFTATTLSVLDFPCSSDFLAAVIAELRPSLPKNADAIDSDKLKVRTHEDELAASAFGALLSVYDTMRDYLRRPDLLVPCEPSHVERSVPPWIRPKRTHIPAAVALLLIICVYVSLFACVTSVVHIATASVFHPEGQRRASCPQDLSPQRCLNAPSSDSKIVQRENG